MAKKTDSSKTQEKKLTLSEIYKSEEIGTLLEDLETFDLKKGETKDDEYLQFAHLLIQLSAIQKNWKTFSGAVESKINAIKREIGRVNKKVYTDLTRQGIVSGDAPREKESGAPKYAEFYTRAISDLIRAKKKGPFLPKEILTAMKEQPKTGRPTNQNQMKSQLRKLVKAGVLTSIDNGFNLAGRIPVQDILDTVEREKATA